MKWWDWMPKMILVFWMLSFKPTFSLTFFTFIKKVVETQSLKVLFWFSQNIFSLPVRELNLQCFPWDYLSHLPCHFHSWQVLEVLTHTFLLVFTYSIIASFGLWVALSPYCLKIRRLSVSFAWYDYSFYQDWCSYNNSGFMLKSRSKCSCYRKMLSTKGFVVLWHHWEVSGYEAYLFIR